MLHHESPLLSQALFRPGPFLLLLIAATFAGSLHAEDGYRLWLRYDRLASADRQVGAVDGILVPGTSSVSGAVRDELVAGLSGLLGRPIPVQERPKGKCLVVAGTPRSSPLIADLGLPLAGLGPEGFCIRTVDRDGRRIIAIAGPEDRGVLYGAFHLLRLIQTGQAGDHLYVAQQPKLQIRILNHWDTLGGEVLHQFENAIPSIAASSIWRWKELPKIVDDRIRDYGRANASIGINGTVLSNVNSEPASFSSEYLHKTAAIAGALRPYGMRVYLSARLDAPMVLGKLPTADPLEAGVRAWWKAKVDEIYGLIPDFGGFLVKADSEGQPGPKMYKRTQADGANLLAEALASHDGVVMWRTFTYHFTGDRHTHAYEEFMPLDGAFAPNVILQTKNGPIDFQPREPFHPLFGRLERTPVMPEVQIMQEYLGRSNCLVFLAPMWREFLDSDTGATTTGASVAQVVDGTVYRHRLTGMAGVANIGSPRNWTGHHFAQANWYAFGRLAWDHGLSSDQIAREWIRMTFSCSRKAEEVICRIMLGSRQAVVDYQSPLGLICWDAGHYLPGAWGLRYDWVNHHRADSSGIGYNRTGPGSNGVSTYRDPIRARFMDPATCPEDYLLYFHHLPWRHSMSSGRTLWDEFCFRFHRGAIWVKDASWQWGALKNEIDPERYADVALKWQVQLALARHWRDSGIFFKSCSGLLLSKECLETGGSPTGWAGF